MSNEAHGHGSYCRVHDRQYGNISNIVCDSSCCRPGTIRAPYGSCKEAHADGAYNIRKGDPGYSKKLDRDGDGIACEG